MKVFSFFAFSIFLLFPVAAEADACPIKEWANGTWTQLNDVSVLDTEISNIKVSKNGARFKSNGKWYLTTVGCGKKLQNSRKPASASSQVEAKASLKNSVSDQKQVRFGIEYSGISRTIGLGSQTFELAGTAIGAKFGYASRSRISARGYWGWLAEVFAGVSSVTTTTNSPLLYTGSNVLTGVVRSGLMTGYQFSKNWFTELNLGVGASYLQLEATTLAGVTSPSAVKLFPLLGLGLGYQSSSDLAYRFDVISQGIASDIGFIGGIQWGF